VAHRAHGTLSYRTALLAAQVEPLREDCVYEDVEAGTEVDVRALVFRGGKLDIKLRVRALPACASTAIRVIPLPLPLPLSRPRRLKTRTVR